MVLSYSFLYMNLIHCTVNSLFISTFFSIVIGQVVATEDVRNVEPCAMILTFPLSGTAMAPRTSTNLTNLSHEIKKD
ncbi:hypothetical protein V1517DRAFT_326977 [Lipomyces orientalis]|uniref:Uncharacterized protein n=1 Tax=Lipomyces orientalis TaxID=1233043 RepID=A0ACC3TJD9_9ASCO